MSGHTKGPWIVQKGAGWIITRPEAKGRREAALMVGMHAGVSLISAPHHYDDDAEAKANAYLMAAAPDLLEALKKSEKLLRSLMSAIGGNDKLPGCEDFYRGYNAVTSRVAAQSSEIFAEVSEAIAKAEGKL